MVNLQSLFGISFESGVIIALGTVTAISRKKLLGEPETSVAATRI